eukprot:g24184.t1
MVWFPGPFERSGSKLTAIALQEDEYVKVKDTSSGKKWVQKGKALVFPEPTWQVEGGVCKAWALKSYEYLRLMNKVTGKVESHRGEQTVFPGPDDELLDGQVMQLIDLKVHEYVKILDQSTGTIRVESGSNGTSKQVFLGPHDKVLDNGKKKAVEVDGEHAVLVRDKSSGQVRLVQELIKLADHEALIVKNKQGEFQYFYEFMDSSHSIAKKVWEEDTGFYASRGVSLFRTQGQIEQERLNGDLLAIKHQHSEAEAEVVGRAEANKVAAFIAGLEAKVPKLEDRMALWQVLRKNEALSAISEGNASLYYTPSDVDLSIEAKR